MTHAHLAQPFHLSGLRMPNRVVMPPLVVWKAGTDGSVTQATLDHYEASAGAGMVIVEATAVSPEGRLARSQLGIFEDRHVEGLSGLAASIHSRGAVASIQIHHAGRNTNRENTQGLVLVAPSAVASRLGSPAADVPAALDESGIERILDCFAQAARRAKVAGFDAVEVHGAHGYLVSQFLSPLANRRDDRWGGNLENRARFLREALRRIRQAAGGDLLASCRLGVADGIPGGLTLEEGLQVAQWLEEDGVPYLHVSSGLGDPPRLGPDGSPWSDRLLLAAEARKRLRIPVIGVGGLVTPEQADRALGEGLADLVAIGRGLLADPQWVRKALGERQGSIHLCRQCPFCHHFRHPERCPARKAAAAQAD